MLTVAGDIGINTNSQLQANENTTITAANIRMFSSSALIAFGIGTTIDVAGQIHVNTNSQLSVKSDNAKVTVDGGILLERRSSFDMFSDGGPPGTIIGNVAMGGFGGGNSDANLGQVIIDGGTIDCGFNLPNVLGGMPTLVNGASIVNCGGPGPGPGPGPGIPPP
jgi:hypothetical protein